MHLIHFHIYYCNKHMSILCREQNFLLDNNENNAHKVQLTDMDDQQLQFLEMSNELANLDGEVVAFKMFLQYCPEAITYLFDRCLMTRNDQVRLFIRKV